MTKGRITGVILLLVVAVMPKLWAADTKVQGELYSQYEYQLSDAADGANEFSLGRAYVTVKSKLSDFTSVRITTDLRESTIMNGSKDETRYDIILKYGYLDWSPAFAQKKMTIRFGLQPTLYIDYQNGLWGRRYLAKTATDEYKMLTSADLGASILVPLGTDGKTGTLGLSVFNGTSYTGLTEMNSQKNVNFTAYLNPLTNNEKLKNSALVGQYYTGTLNEEIPDSIKTADYKQQLASIGGLFAYNETVDLGLDLNWLTKGDGPDAAETKSSAMSFHGTLYLNALSDNEASAFRTLNLFGRMDLVDPNTDLDNDGQTEIIGGVECSPTKGFKASVNLRSTSYEDDSDSESSLFVNTLFKF